MKLSKKIVPRWGFQPGTNIAIAIVAVSAKKKLYPGGDFNRRPISRLLSSLVNS
jgi:hypothetical protein